VPQVGSPVIDAGTDLSGLGITALNSDYLGNARYAGAAWDTGAIEYGAGASPTFIARLLRFVELLLPIAGIGWHCKKWLGPLLVTGFAYGMTTTVLVIEHTKTLSYDTALKTAQMVVQLTKKDL